MSVLPGRRALDQEAQPRPHRISLCSRNSTEHSQYLSQNMSVPHPLSLFLRQQQQALGIVSQLEFLREPPSDLGLEDDTQSESLSLRPRPLWTWGCRCTHTPVSAHTLTMRCWKSQERMILVACLGKTPRLFLDFLSSLSRREVRSRLTFRARGEKVSISSLADWQLGTCCHGDDGRFLLPAPFPIHSRALGGHLSLHLTEWRRRERGCGEVGREETEESINHPIVSLSGGVYSLPSDFLSVTMVSPHGSL